MPSNDPSSFSRRKFIQRSTLAAATVGLSQISGLSQTNDELLAGENAKSSEAVDKDAPQMRVLLHEANGEPLDRERVKTLNARDLENDTLPQSIATAEGRARVTLANKPMQVSCRLNVPGFGEVYCYADNNGKG